ncbi:Holliday junction branch migration protein RuvA [Breznakiella homolactica]|uniref:Holliday junction branch migration complex subunit RuvA n=1 Tax=Breznakiella homolactica TaxID=2798577 RepID=A0A7T7XKK6_9SPIR|nr:Holliday junction branch migration protein RuvA [Breznakiella homolactica]QQO08020.1 Holliday junction branch migration protein RuvA [Breznakiella homolactica]
MFNSIQGIITEKLSETIRILTGGIEWDIAAPGTDIAKMAPAGEKGRLFTWLYHREDSMRLFGFADENRRNTFLELLKVDGIGPKQAIKIMGNIGQEELERALETEDIARLEAVPGLGKKTAQKMILSLKGKLVRAADVPQALGPHQELVEALAEMGYDKRAAADAVARAAETLDKGLSSQEKEKQLFKAAILFLSGQ